MRRVILATLVLIPVMATAQTSTSTGSKAAPASATLIATANKPASPAAPRDMPTPAAAPASLYHETVTEHVDAFYLNPALDSGTTFTIFAESNTDNAPKLVHIEGTRVPAGTTASDLTVEVSMVVDANGTPRNLSIEKSAGADIDAKTLEAVKLYRFQPATVNHRATDAAVTLDIKLQKK